MGKFYTETLPFRASTDDQVGNKHEYMVRCLYYLILCHTGLKSSSRATIFPLHISLLTITCINISRVYLQLCWQNLPLVCNISTKEVLSLSSRKKVINHIFTGILLPLFVIQLNVFLKRTIDVGIIFKSRGKKGGRWHESAVPNDNYRVQDRWPPQATKYPMTILREWNRMRVGYRLLTMLRCKYWQPRKVSVHC